MKQKKNYVLFVVCSIVIIVAVVSCRKKWSSTPGNPVGKKVCQALRTLDKPLQFSPGIENYHARQFIDINAVPNMDKNKLIELNVQNSKGDTVLAWRIMPGSTIRLLHTLTRNNKYKLFGKDDQDIISIDLFDSKGSVSRYICQPKQTKLKLESPQDYCTCKHQANTIEYWANFRIVPVNTNTSGTFVYQKYPDPKYHNLPKLKIINRFDIPSEIKRINIKQNVTTLGNNLSIKVSGGKANQYYSIFKPLFGEKSPDGYGNRGFREDMALFYLKIILYANRNKAQREEYSITPAMVQMIISKIVQPLYGCSTNKAKNHLTSICTKIAKYDDKQLFEKTYLAGFDKLAKIKDKDKALEMALLLIARAKFLYGYRGEIYKIKQANNVIFVRGREGNKVFLLYKPNPINNNMEFYGIVRLKDGVSSHRKSFLTNMLFK